MNSTTEFYPGEGLPFITCNPDLGKPGAPYHLNRFDFKNCSYMSGLARGMEAAYRLMLAAERGVLTDITGEEDQDVGELFRIVIEAACAQLDPSKPDGGRGAAVGLLSTFGRVLTDTARLGTWRVTMMNEIADEKVYAKDEYESSLMALDRFAASMTPPVATPRPAKGSSARSAAPVERTARKAVTA